MGGENISRAFLGVLAKTPFVQNAKTQFENTKTQFKKANTQFKYILKISYMF